MFRVFQHRSLQAHRFISYSNKKQKIFIIRTKHDNGRKLVSESTIQQKLRAMYNDLTYLQRLSLAQRKLSMSVQQFIHDKKLKEKISEIKRTQAEKIKRELRVLPGEIVDQWKVFRASETYRKTLDAPRRSVELINFAVMKTRENWKIFMESETKDRLVEVATFTWFTSKRIANKTYKFIYEAYFETPLQKNSKH